MTTTTEERSPGISGFNDPKEFAAPVPAPGRALAEMGLGGAGDTGAEGARSQELQTPGLRICQANSPQLIRGNALQIPGISAGDIFNNSTGEFWPGEKGVRTVIFARDYTYGVWSPRNEDGSGGGFRGQKLPDDPMIKDLIRQHGRFKKLPFMQDGDPVEAVETGQLYVLYGNSENVAAATAQAAYVSMSSTNMPVYQRWFTRHMGWRYMQADGKMREAPLWAYEWQLTTVPQSRGTLNWFTFRLEPIEGKPLESLTMPRDAALFHEGARMYEQFKAGMVKAVQEEREPGMDEEELPQI